MKNSSGQGFYRRWTVSTWTESRFTGLSGPEPNAKDLYIYLTLGSHTAGLPGLFRVGLLSLAEALHWDHDIVGTQAAAEELEATTTPEGLPAPLARFDLRARVVFVPDGIKNDPPSSWKNSSYYARAFADIPDSPLKWEWLRGLVAWAKATGKAQAAEGKTSILAPFADYLAQLEAPLDAPTDVPSHAPSGAPTDVPSHAPSGAPTDAPCHAPSDAPADAPCHAPGNAPADAPCHAPGDAPADAPCHAPGDAEREEEVEEEQEEEASGKEQSGLVGSAASPVFPKIEKLKKLNTDPAAEKLADLLIRLMLKNDPKADVPDKTGEPVELLRFWKWVNTFRLIHEIDGRTYAEQRQVMLWCQAQTFYAANVLSPSAFRRRYASMRLKDQAATSAARGRREDAKLSKRENNQ